MFGSHASSASPYAPVLDHRQPRSPPSPASPLPSGECRFILLHPSIQNQRCSCQGFRLNRAIPGSSCECGHLACYHVPSTPNHDNINLVSFTQHIALMEKVRKLEEDLVDSQHALEDSQKALEDFQRARAEDNMQARETMRQLWRAMEQKMVGLEDKVEAAVDMTCETRDDINVAKAKIESVEDSTMALESKLDGIKSDDDEDRSRSNTVRRPKRKSPSPSTKQSKSKSPRQTPRRSPPRRVTPPIKPREPTSAALISPKPEPISLSMSPSFPPLASSHLQPAPSPLPPPTLLPASDFASPAETIKAYAPNMVAPPKPKSKASSTSRDSTTSSPYDTFDTPSPVDFLAAIAKMPMKRQIREVDNAAVEALDGAGGRGAGPGGRKRKRPVGVAGAGEGTGAREIGVVKERLLSMPVEDMG